MSNTNIAKLKMEIEPPYWNAYLIMDDFAMILGTIHLEAIVDDEELAIEFSNTMKKAVENIVGSSDGKWINKTAKYQSKTKSTN